ncbi:DUF2062 domain-containing protein [Candidatus Woesearchaeota archaeon]|nr:DUF2062 domain-containing protein [Candidatus Woesearchaeota archaeon]
MIRKLGEKTKKHLHEAFSTESSAHSIALGFAIGTFVGIFPTPGFGVVLGFLIAFLYKKVNKLAVLAALALWNPLVLSSLYTLGYQIGDIIMGPLPVVEYEVTFLENAYHFSMRLLLGATMIASVFSVVGYFVVKKMVLAYRKGGAGFK